MTPPDGLRGPRALAVFVPVLIALAALDLITKDIAFRRIGEREIVVVIDGFLNLLLARNYGAAFSILTGKQAFLVAVGLFAIGYLGWLSWTAKSNGAGFQVLLGMLGAGVVGNLHDRIRLGYVRDFIDVHVGARHWPTFNVADIFVDVGVVLLVIKLWRDESKARAATPPRT